MLKGIVVSNISNLYNVEIEEEVYSCNARGKFKNEEISPVAGDYVEIEVVDETKKTGVITKISERINYTKRPKMSNLSQIILVISMKLPKPDLELLDKQLAYAEYMRIKPIICLNKIDLEKDDIINDIEQTYTKIGYKVVKTNAQNGTGVNEIKEILRNNITAFSGNSGVGKSTLINSIFKRDMTQEGDISKRNQRGKNTTTSIKLYEIDKNTYIADTPGFSTFDISEIGYKNLDKYFIEFDKQIEKCEFVGCTHIKEQNCGVKQAVEQGKIDKGRYERFCKLSQGGRLLVGQRGVKKW